MSSVKVVDSVPSMWLSMWLSGEACGYRDDMTCFRPCLCVACKRTFRQKRQLRGRSLNSAAGTAWWKNEQKIISDLFLKKKKKKNQLEALWKKMFRRSPQKIFCETIHHEPLKIQRSNGIDQAYWSKGQKRPKNDPNKLTIPKTPAFTESFFRLSLSIDQYVPTKQIQNHSKYKIFRHYYIQYCPDRKVYKKAMKANKP